MTTHPPQLDYAPQPAWLSRKQVRHWVVRGIALGAAMSAFWWSPSLSRNIEAYYWRCRCMLYTAPADRVVYEEDPEAVSKLIAADPAYLRDRWIHKVVMYDSGEWRRLARLEKQGDDGGVFFLHGRKTPDGRSRLVAVVGSFCESVIQNPPPSLVLLGEVSPPPPVGLGMHVNALRPQRPLRVFAGQPDPADASHFTIGYEVNGQKGTIDGWLQDDDTVKLQVRGGLDMLQ